MQVSHATIDSLPDELLFDILVRLPADFLHNKARLVCIKWRDIIHSKNFINTHVNHHSSYGLLLSSQSLNHPIYVTATQGRTEVFELSYNCQTKIFGSCNGLALELYQDQPNDESHPHLLNLATKLLVLIPEVPRRRNVGVYPQYCGIAYSAASMKYKVILPYHVYVPDPHTPYARGSNLYICTVGVDKSWREVEMPHLPMVPLSILSLTTEGFIHWGGESGHTLTFDVETEIFTMSRVPSPRQVMHDLRYHYLSTGRYLNVIVARGNFTWDVWEMRPESGEWRKMMPHKIELRAQKFALKYPNQALKPLGWVKYPEILAFCFEIVENVCVFYNVDTHEINTHELPNSCKDYRVFAHRNNLVSFS